MSQENVETVRRGFEVWNAGDMDALRELYDPGIIWRGPEGWPEPGPYAGREAVMRQVEQLRETWDSDSFQLISDLIDVGDRVAVRFIWRGAGHGPESRACGWAFSRAARLDSTDRRRPQADCSRLLCRICSRRPQLLRAPPER